MTIDKELRDTMDDVKKAVRAIIRYFDNSDREGLQDTPDRVAKAYHELLIPPPLNITMFDSNGYDQMIISHGIKYYTFCEHHLLPFFGEVHIGYLPDKKIVGLSKLARVVDHFSKRLNTQEYMTDNIANILELNLKPKGVGVIATGRHLCQEMRGIKIRGKMITTALRGSFLEAQTKEEFIKVCQ